VRTCLIITTYNRKDALALVLDSAARQRRKPDELVVADDGSRPDTGKLVAAFAARAPFAVRHSWQEDLGFRAAASRNRAFARSSSDYLVMIDGDIMLHPWFLEDHVRAAREGRFVQGSRVLLSQEATTRALASGRIPLGPFAKGIRNRLNAFHWSALSRLASHRSADVFRVRSANLACWRADVLRVNGFDEDFVGWGREDSDFVARLQHAGVERLQLKFGAIGYHLWHQEEPRELLPRNQRILEETLATRRVRCANGIDKHLR
jgi:glycosyltransferase involved in cell wall biosynthesis